MTKILFIDNGIEFDGDTVRKKPVGGAENAFVSLVEELAKLNLKGQNLITHWLLNITIQKKLWLVKL